MRGVSDAPPESVRHRLPTVDGPAPVVTLPARGQDRVWFAQAIRGIACLLVVWNHFTQVFPELPGAVRSYALVPPGRTAFSTPWSGASGWLGAHHINPGSLGVSLFFLTSGFVIPFSLNRGGLRGFFLRRFFRLYPTYWVVIGSTILLLLWQSRTNGIPFPHHTGTIVLNSLLLHPYAGRGSMDGVNWTLAVEELFYACAAIVAWRRALARAPVLLGLGGMAFATTCVAARWTGGSVLVTLIGALAYNATMVTFILIGVALHHHFQGTWSAGRTIVVGAALGLIFFAEVHIGPVKGIERQVFVSYSISFAVFMAAYLARRRLPRVAAVNWFADVSYPLYLVHPILGYIVLDSILRWTGRYLVALPVSFIIVTAWALVLHKVVEAPSKECGRRLSRRRPASEGKGAQQGAPGQG